MTLVQLGSELFLWLFLCGADAFTNSVSPESQIHTNKDISTSAENKTVNYQEGQLSNILAPAGPVAETIPAKRKGRILPFIWNFQLSCCWEDHMAKELPKQYSELFLW